MKDMKIIKFNKFEKFLLFLVVLTIIILLSTFVIAGMIVDSSEKPYEQGKGYLDRLDDYLNVFGNNLSEVNEIDSVLTDEYFQITPTPVANMSSSDGTDRVDSIQVRPYITSNQNAINGVEIYLEGNLDYIYEFEQPAAVIIRDNILVEDKLVILFSVLPTGCDDPEDIACLEFLEEVVESSERVGSVYVYDIGEQVMRRIRIPANRTIDLIETTGDMNEIKLLTYEGDEYLLYLVGYSVHKID